MQVLAPASSETVVSYEDLSHRHFIWAYLDPKTEYSTQSYVNWDGVSFSITGRPTPSGANLEVSISGAVDNGEQVLEIPNLGMFFSVLDINGFTFENIDFQKSGNSFELVNSTDNSCFYDSDADLLWLKIFGADTNFKIVINSESSTSVPFTETSDQPQTTSSTALNLALVGLITNILLL